MQAKGKVDIDERFRGVFSEARFQKSVTVDKRGRHVGRRAPDAVIRTPAAVAPTQLCCALARRRRRRSRRTGDDFRKYYRQQDEEAADADADEARGDDAQVLRRWAPTERRMCMHAARAGATPFP